MKLLKQLMLITSVAMVHTAPGNIYAQKHQSKTIDVFLIGG